MKHRISLNLVGAIVAPAVLAAFVIGMVVSGALSCGARPANAQAAGGYAAVNPAGESPFVAVAQTVMPAVVSISAEKTVSARRQQQTPELDGGPFDEFFRRFLEGMPGLPEQSRTALGSGVIIDPAGYIVTNNHVVNEFDKIVVKLSDNTEIPAKDVKVVGKDSKTDLAVIKVTTDHSLTALRMGKAEDIKVGDWAIAIGNAFGLEGTVTVGVISAKGRSGLPLQEGPSYQDFIQTDASINPGNSGGALVNARGELIGINSAIRSPVGASVGIGFAVPVDMVQSVTDQLIKHGKVVRGFLGIKPQPVTESIRKAKGLADTHGVLVSEVVDGQPAQKAGVEDGDIIVKVNETDIRDVDQFRMLVAEFAPGTTVSLSIVRGSGRLTKRVKLSEYPEDEVAAAPGGQDDEPTVKLGLGVRTLTADERAEAGVSGGVVVERIDRGSAADEAGLQRGDIILEVGDQKINNAADFRRRVVDLAGKSEAILFRLKRGDARLFIAVEPER